MRSLILFVATSLDGFIAREDGSVDWLFTEGEYGFDEFLEAVDTVVMGRRTHDFMLAHGQKAFPGKRNLVFSRSDPAREYDEVEFHRSGLVEKVRELKSRDGQGIWLVGGGEIASQCLDADLVDRIDVAIHPVILGRGIPLYVNIRGQKDLRLLDHVVHENGLVQLSYEVRRRSIQPTEGERCEGLANTRGAVRRVG